MDILYLLILGLGAIGFVFFRGFFAEAGKDGWKWVKEKWDSREIKDHLREKTVEPVQKQTLNNQQDALLNEMYISAATDAWKKQGTAEHYLNSLEIPRKEKEKIFRAACLRHKKKEPKINPFAS